MNEERVRAVEGQINGGIVGALAAQNPDNQSNDQVLKALATVTPGVRGPERVLDAVTKMVS